MEGATSNRGPDKLQAVLNDGQDRRDGQLPTVRADHFSAPLPKSPDQPTGRPHEGVRGGGCDRALGLGEQGGVLFSEMGTELLAICVRRCRVRWGGQQCHVPHFFVAATYDTLDLRDIFRRHSKQPGCRIWFRGNRSPTWRYRREVVLVDLVEFDRPSWLELKEIRVMVRLAGQRERRI